MEASLDGRPLPPSEVRRWLRDGAVKRQAAAHPETEKRLRNLGYIR